MKKDFISVLITNYNKGRYLDRCISSILIQKYTKFEILIFDDCSNDQSADVLSKFEKLKNVRILRNKKKKSNYGPINQIYGILKMFRISKGNIISLLDGDDFFKNNKLKVMSDIFLSNKKLNFIQDTAFSLLERKKMKLKKKNHIFSIWPSFFPTSTIMVRRNFFLSFKKIIYSKKYPNLEIDARLVIYSYLTNNFNVLKKSYTYYQYDQSGITSKYEKFSSLWWKKRIEAYSYMKTLMKKKDIKFKVSPDFIFTKLINYLYFFKVN